MYNIQQQVSQNKINTVFNNQIKIGLWNARSINNKTNEIQRHMEDYDILYITETWTNTAKYTRIKGASILHNGETIKDGKTSGSGLMVI